MSHSHKVSKREQNGSLTSEPDSSTHAAPAHSKSNKAGNGEKLRSSRTQKNSFGSDKGPSDTSTPVKSENQSRQETMTKGVPENIRRSLVDELNATGTSVNTSGSGSADAVRRVNQAAQALTAAAGTGTYSPAVSSIRHDSTINSTFNVSTGSSKRSFVSEFENGTIQAQRHELQMLMIELKDRDRELNDMVKAHHHQLMGWEEDRQRILTLENRNSHLEAEAKRKNDQVRALVARLKTMESVEQTKQATLDHIQTQLSNVTEQFSQTQLKLKETQEKSRQMSSMVKELSMTMSKLESKEQEMLSLLKLKDKDLSSASNHLSELSAKLKLMDAKLKDKQKSEATALKDSAQWKDKYIECKRVMDKLKTDLNRSQLEEEESRLELDRNRRDQERLRKQIVIMSEREKRQEELINSQKLKQERTDAELSSMRQLYERQQRDMTLMQLNLDSAKELLAKQNDSDKADNCNISLLLQSPTSGRPVAYYTGDNTVTLPRTYGQRATQNKSAESQSLASHYTSQAGPASNLINSGLASPSLPPSESDQQSPHLAAVGPGRHHHQSHGTTFSSFTAGQTSANQSKMEQSNSNQQSIDMYQPSNGAFEHSQNGGPMSSQGQNIQQEQQQQQKLVRSGIPVMIQQDKATGGGSQRNTPRPSSVTSQYQRSRSLERNQGAAQNRAQSLRSGSTDGRVEDIHSNSQGVVKNGLYQSQNEQYQQTMTQHSHQGQGQQQHLTLGYNSNNSQYQPQHKEDDIMKRAENQLKELQAFSIHLHQDDSLTASVPVSMARSYTPPPKSPRNSPIEFGTPPRLTVTPPGHRTPSPHIRRTTHQTSVNLTPTGGALSPTGVDVSAASATVRVGLTSPGGQHPGPLEDSIVSGDYPEQTGMSASGGVDYNSAADASWVLEGPGDYSSDQWTGVANTSGSSAMGNSHTDNQSNYSVPESPTSKLHRLLTESRQMVQSLERSTYPPFFTQGSLSPIKADAADD